MPKTKIYSKKIFLLATILAVCGLGFFLDVDHADAATYYAAPGGAGTECSISAPCRIKSFWNIAQGGDTLILQNGIYQGADQMINPDEVWKNYVWTGDSNTSYCGSWGNNNGPHITIMAETDGGVTIDGQGSRAPLYFLCQKNFILEGIRAQNASLDQTIFSISRSENIIAKKISVYNSNNFNNGFIVASGNTKNVLIEDCVAMGKGRKMITPIRVSNVTVRRCFMKWFDYDGPVGSPTQLMDLYGSWDNILENNIGTMKPHARNVEGFGLWTHDYSQPSNNNKILGNVVYDTTSYSFFESSATHRTQDTVFSNNVGIDSRYGFLQKGSANLQVENQNIIGANFASYLTDVHSGYCQDCDFEIHGDIRNSIFYNNLKGISNSQKTITKMSVSNDLDGDHYPELSVAGECSSACGTSKPSLTSDFNNLFGIQEYYYYPTSLQGQDDVSIEPNFETETYGRGAYLMRPDNLNGLGENNSDMGAEVLYRYQDGVLTGERLWPWSMEDRICQETKQIFGAGSSVTWDNNGNGCSGGLWKNGTDWEKVYSNTSADVNGDGHVNIEDFKILLSRWLSNITPGDPADINDDNIVNTRDLGIMMSNWSN